MRTSNRKTTTATTSTKVKSVCFDRIASSKGRFFGMLLTDGQRVNAQFRSQSEKYITVYDKHAKQTRRLLKARVATATI